MVFVFRYTLNLTTRVKRITPRGLTSPNLSKQKNISNSEFLRLLQKSAIASPSVNVWLELVVQFDFLI